MAGSIAMSVMTRFGLVDGMSKGFKKMGKSAFGFGNIVKGILSAGLIQQGFRKLKEGMASFVTEASKVEDAVAGFQPLMGGVEQATKLVNRLNKEAATTPFQFEGIASVAKQLLPVMNGSIEKTADTFRMLGDTAGGNMQKLDSITRGYTKALLKGKPDMESLNMIAEAGVPIFSEMAKSMGIAQDQLFVLSKQGKLTKDDLTKTFQRMTSEGGIFYKGMEIASRTLTGRMSTLKDNIALTAGVIGSTFIDQIKGGVSGVSDIAMGVREWVTSNQELIKTNVNIFIDRFRQILNKILPPIKNVIQSIFNLGKTVIGVLKNAFEPIFNFLGGQQTLLNVFAGIMNFVSDAIDGIRMAIEFLSPVLQFLIPILALWAAKMIIVNTLMTMNPMTAFVIAIVAVVAAIGWLIKNWDILMIKLQYFIAKVGQGVMFVLGKIGDFFGFLGEKIMEVVGFFGMLINIIGKGLKGAFEGLWNFIQPIIKGITDFAGGIGDFFGGIGQGISDFFTGGDQNKAKAPNRQAPNQAEVDAKQKIDFNGNLNINGAPEGTTFEILTTGAPPIRYNLMGAS